MTSRSGRSRETVGEGEHTGDCTPELDSAGVYLDLSLEDLNYGNLRRRRVSAENEDPQAPRSDSKGEP